MTCIDSKRQCNLGGKTKKQKQRRRTEKRGQERGKCGEEEKLPRGPSIRAAMGTQVSIILWTVSPVVMEAGGDDEEEEDFSPHSRCFTETY